MPIYLTPIGTVSVELLTDLRIAIGSPTILEITDVVLTRYLVRAVRHVNERFPRVAISYFLTVVDQQAYAIPTGRTVIDCWPPSDEGWGGIEFPQLDNPNLDNMAGLDLFNNPALFLEYYAKLNAYHTMTRNDWEDIGGQVYVYPCPGTTDNRVYYVYAYDWTFATLNNVAKEAVLLWAEMMCLDHYYNKQGKSKFKSVSSKGVSVSMSPTEVTARIADLRVQFDELVEGNIVIPIERG